jgi:hypothetical protein
LAHCQCACVGQLKKKEDSLTAYAEQHAASAATMRSRPALGSLSVCLHGPMGWSAEHLRMLEPGHWELAGRKSMLGLATQEPPHQRCMSRCVHSAAAGRTNGCVDRHKLNYSCLNAVSALSVMQVPLPTTQTPLLGNICISALNGGWHKRQLHN